MATVQILDDAEVAALEPCHELPRGAKAARLRARLRRAGLWLPNQIAGRRWPIGCVALEVTQRCNLDCTLCYLSDHSEAVRDLPLAEILRRIDLIHAHYGPGTDVQITGGEPTLRRREELVEIVAYVQRREMRSSLFTNGIRATRELLAELARAGLTDVAFHVDTTQQRKGFATEVELNRLRDEYIERARGLGLSVFFNTTIHDGNLHEAACLTRFFASRADVVRLASFQLQAQTGRGLLGARGQAVSTESVIAAIGAGLGASISFDRFMAGHPSCNRYATALLVGDRAHDAFFDAAFATDFMRRTARRRIDRGTPAAGAKALVGGALSSLGLALRSAGWLARQIWRARWDLARAGGRVRKISFVIHNFMDAAGLEAERLDSCVFMAMTQDGPMSMCAYNARRDAFLLKPIATTAGPWDPLAQRRSATGIDAVVAYPIRWLKGRPRAAAVSRRSAHSNASKAGVDEARQ